MSMNSYNDTDNRTEQLTKTMMVYAFLLGTTMFVLIASVLIAFIVLIWRAVL